MGAAQARIARAKLSTTVSRETYAYLEQKVESGEVTSIAEALDRSISRVRKLENREKLAKATERYFDQLEPRAVADESALAKNMASLAQGIDFDQEL